ncbi:hypothetical protein [Gallaecimonas sp. GXIMD4217]|uniref:hypothetical protein n=1 Tax=Gallaecimonas sp. GXIMD4217 TaxID=3131927 RepID=UPI00311B27BD
MKATRILTTLALAGSLALLPGLANAERTTGRGTGPVVYVISQDLYFDSIVIVDSLPMKGRFQELIPTADGLETDFGPGDVGYLGGRWWLDTNGDGVMDEGDTYFLCPLLGPGRESP